jgi:pimeloyl-ACP methyl ester carboxylesterase
VTGTPVVFIHGLWLHATSWGPWLSLFEEAGYRPMTVTWPGEADTVELARATPESVANFGIDDVTNHIADQIAMLDRKPIIIGHSFGGMIAEKLLGQDKGAAAIGIDAAQIKGVLPVPLSSLRATLPVFKNPANIHKSVSLTEGEFRYGFGNAVSADESDELFAKWNIPSPGRPLFEAAVANFALHSPDAVNTKNDERGPLLLIMGGQDKTVPEAVTKSAFKQYRHSSAVTDLHEFADRGHSLIIDSGWREVADACLTWLAAQDLKTA